MRRAMNDLVGRKKIKGANPFTSGMSSDASLRRSVNRIYNRLRNDGLTPEGFAEYREQQLSGITDPLAEQRAGEIMDNLWAYAVQTQDGDTESTDVATAALHNPDMVAGGDPMPDDIGWRRINSSIGSRWGNTDRDKVRIIHSKVMEWMMSSGIEAAISADETKKEEILSKYNMNVDLEPD